MPKILTILFLVIFAVFSLAPQFVLAAGLVPCQGVVGEVGGATSLGCSLCDLAKLTNNVVNWLVNMSFVMATIFAIYGGYLIMTAGLSPKQYEQGKDVVLAVAIGLAIVLTSWIIINTALKFLTGSENWYRIDCGVGAGAAAIGGAGIGATGATTEAQDRANQQIEAAKILDAELRSSYQSKTETSDARINQILNPTGSPLLAEPTYAEIQDAISHLPANATGDQINAYIYKKRKASGASY